MKIDKEQLRKIDKKYMCDEWGKKSRFFWRPESVRQLGLPYREGRGYKLIVSDYDKTLKTAQRFALVQTYYANLGLAPRVYNIGWVDEYPYLEVELLKNYSQKFKIEGNDFIKAYDVDLDKDKNFMDGKYLDFHGFKLNKNKFEKWLMKEINDKTHWGHNNGNDEKYAYQLGKRDMAYRIKQMKLSKINFKNKKVFDVGCNLGLFLHYVSERGGLGVGFDTKEVMDLAWLYKFWRLPLSKIEFRDFEIRETFDIILYLAMVHTFGYPKPVARLTVFEGHNLQDMNDVGMTLMKQGFSKVKFINYTEDRGKRPVFWCWR